MGRASVLRLRPTGILLGMVLSGLVPAAEGFGAAGEPVRGELLVRFAPGRMPTEGAATLRSAGTVEVRPFLPEGMLLSAHPIAQWAHVILPQGTDDQAAMEEIARLPSVIEVAPNVYGELLAVPGDPRFPEQWALHNTGQTGGTPGADIDASAAWELQADDGSAVVAIVDTGIDYHHPDLVANLWRNPGEIPGNGVDDDRNGLVDDYFGANYLGAPSGDPLDTHALSHGTHVAGIVGAVADNGQGIAGTARGVRLMAVRWISSGFLFDVGTCAGAVFSILYATMMGADVINASWAIRDCAALRNAVEFAAAHDVLFVAAAGNAGTDNDVVPSEPATFRMTNLVAVAATDHHDRLAVFSTVSASNFGAQRVQIAAPGADILSTLRSGAYGLRSGTSMAAPHVSGVAASIIARHPGIAAKDVKTSLVLGADRLTSLDGKVLQSRRLNARGALLQSDAWVGTIASLWTCDDGIDNDGDGAADYPADPGCASVFPDDSEASGCGAGFDFALLLPLIVPLRRILAPNGRHGTRRLWRGREGLCASPGR